MTDENKKDEVVKDDVLKGLPPVEDMSVTLTEKEKLKLEAQARAEVIKDLKKAESERFLKAAKDRIQAEVMFGSGKDDSGDDLATIQLDLASFPKYIMLDGQVYHSGRSYTKRTAVINVLREQMARGWEQEAARLGERVVDVNYKRKVLGRNGLQLM